MGWRRLARVAKHYPGVDASRLTYAQVAALDALIEVTRAEELLLNHRAELSPDELRECVKLVTGDAEQAATAWAYARLAEMRQKAGF